MTDTKLLSTARAIPPGACCGNCRWWADTNRTPSGGGWSFDHVKDGDGRVLFGYARTCHRPEWEGSPARLTSRHADLVTVTGFVCAAHEEDRYRAPFVP